MDPKPVAVVKNPCPYYTMVNSVNFHPTNNLFCVVYTNGNRVDLYKLDASSQSETIQTLSNPLAKLCAPQHAIYSQDGEKIIVANWVNQTLTIYQKGQNDFFHEIPINEIFPPPHFSNYRPHGIALSPCGNLLTIAHGASHLFGRAIALYRMTHGGSDCELVDVLQGEEELPGIPKGITFSPDGNCLIVTFEGINSLMIFDLDRTSNKILTPPRQIIAGEETLIVRPEDVRISPDGKICAITNSETDCVTFYPYDAVSNRIAQNTPCYILQNPEADLCFPHNVAFSPDGAFVLITQFGQISITDQGDIFWDHTMPVHHAKINVYKIIR